ncbi:MAG: hypothetical protein JWM57_2160 [Phycisphaerales bacterium]|nr:hypothetical protein [Phycisphaerales bacterium]
MTREVRANAIFVCVLVVLCAPGFYMLMKKRLSGSGDSNAQPVPALYSAAYNQPPPFDPRLPRIEPATVRDWVRGLLQARQGSTVRVARDGESPDAGPVISDQFVTQLAGISANSDGSLALSLLRWADTGEQTTESPKVTADLGGRSVELIVNRMDPIEVPPNVRHALQAVGYITPPLRVWWIACTVPTRPGDPTPRAVTLQGKAIPAEVLIINRTPATRPVE